MKYLFCTAGLVLAPNVPAQAAEIGAGATLEYTDFSSDFGERVVGELNASVHWTDTTVSFDLAHGSREFGDEDFSATRFGATVYHDWSDRIYTKTNASVATDSPVFPTHRLKQDVNVKIGRNGVASVGIGHNRYFGGRDALTWSAGGTYYFRSGFVSYRYTGFDVEQFGRTHGHLASVRINDPRGRGLTQAWFGAGTSVHEFEVLPTIEEGDFRSVALRRLQPLRGNLALDIGVGRSWYDTGLGDYKGTSIRVGVALLR